jgi:CRP-like cAMP-binding protein/tRNA A-37 threonylcarbamoyl transferase component Bud32
VTEPKPGLLPGALVGRYKVVRHVASGGMAAVYEAQHLDLMKSVALKVMHPEYAQDPSLVRRFVLEARAASRLRHPHVIAVTDVGIEEGSPYMVLDYLEGEDLFALFRREGPLPIRRVADLLLPIVSAVAAVHAEGILHRDLKPENIFVSRGRGAREHPMLLDFGISRSVAGGAGGRGLTRVGQTVGTPEYMSPEHLLATSDLDARADQYALGIILYEALTGAPPYRDESLTNLIAAIMAGGAPPPSAVRPSASTEVDPIVLRAIATARDARFPSVRDLGRALWPFASPLVQAVWAEELGDASEMTARLSAPGLQAGVTQPPDATDLPAAGVPALVRPSDLRAFAAFEDCSDAALASLLASTQAQRFEAGDEIVRQGAHGHACYLVIAGEVDVVKSTARGKWILGRLRAGSAFGQISLVDNLPRTASVVAAAEVVVVVIKRDAFDALLATTNEVAEALRLHVAVSGIRHLRRATTRLAGLLGRERVHASADPRRELVYLQSAAREWSLPDEEESDRG